MKKIDRAMLGETVAPFLAGTLICLAVILVNTIIKNAAQIFQLQSSWLVTAKWLFYRVPSFLTLALPIGTMLATSMVLIRMGRDGEVTSLRMGGLALRRMFLPFYLVGALLSVVTYAVMDYLAPAWALRADEVLLGQLLSDAGELVKSNATFRAEGNSFCHVTRIDLQRQEMYGVTIYLLDRGRPVTALTAPLCLREGGTWVLRNGRTTHFDDRGHLVRTEPFDRHPVQFAENIVELWDSDKNPNAMTAAELSERLGLMEIAGDSGNAIRFRYFLHNRWAMPATCLVFVFLAAPLSLRFGHPRSHPYSAVLLTIIVVFFANGTINWARTIALSGPQAWLHPVLAAWLHVLVFSLIAVALSAFEHGQRK